MIWNVDHLPGTLVSLNPIPYFKNGKFKEAYIDYISFVLANFNTVAYTKRFSPDNK